MEKVSIIIPAYNEEKRIGKTLEEYVLYFEQLREAGKIDYEILVVINNTKDNTEKVVKTYQKSCSRILFLNLKKGGKGYAITKGFRDSLTRKNELIGFVDADMATPPEAFYKLITSLKNSGGVIASRWIKGSIIKTKQSFLRRVLSRGFNFMVKTLFLLHYTDTQCGAKLFRRHAVEKIIDKIGMTRWAFDVELLYKMKLAGFKIKEIPTIWEDKKDTKLDVTKVPFEMFTGILRLRLMNSPLRFIITGYDKLPNKLKIHRLIK